MYEFYIPNHQGDLKTFLTPYYYLPGKVTDSYLRSTFGHYISHCITVNQTSIVTFTITTLKWTFWTEPLFEIASLYFTITITVHLARPDYRINGVVHL